MDFFRELKDYFIPSHQNVYRPHILRKPWLIFFLAIILTAEGVFVVSLVARQSAFEFVATVLPGEVVALTNIERSKNSVGAVTNDSLLALAAQAKAEDMAKNDYFSHVGPDGKEPWVWIKEAGYNYQYAGENLAVRFNDSSEVVNAWMASPTHRANITKAQYTNIGIGIAYGNFKGEPATYVVQYFGAPRSTVAAVATPAEEPAPEAPALAEVAQVEGVADVATPLGQSISPEEQSPWSSFAKNLLSGENQPDDVVLWILGAVASLLVVGMALAVFVHIQIQPTDMLIGGATVAVVALAFLALNVQTISPGGDQTAAVFGAMPTQGGFIDSNAGATFQP